MDQYFRDDFPVRDRLYPADAGAAVGKHLFLHEGGVRAIVKCMKCNLKGQNAKIVDKETARMRP